MSIVTSWSPFFQSQRRMRGRGLQNAGRVKLLPAANGEILRAEIEDSGKQQVEFRQEGADAWAECTCEAYADGAYCEHIWATIMQLALSEEPVAPELSPERLAGLRVRAPRARKREDGGAAVRSHSEPAWMSRLTLLRPPMLDDPRGGFDLLPPQRQVAYVVLPESSTRHGGLVLELRQRTPLTAAGGGWSKLKPLRLTSEALPSLPEPVDRELCALVLGSGRVEDGQMVEGVRGERSYSRFRLPGAAQRALLKRMVETGRCYIDLDENGAGREAPLHWDDAETLGTWTLWVVGDETPERDLVVHAELRRRHERMSVEAPHFLVTGPDGVVFWQDRAGPLDDRGAPRWISQFRGEGRGSSMGGNTGESGGPGPLRVAAADAERFLDRMYMLPQLPEIDLPEALTRNEHRIRPVPHLDLFSADAVLNGSAKSQLLARVWFDYAGVRVNPMQPGRFVTVVSEPAAAATGAEGGEDTTPVPESAGDAAAVDPVIDDAEGLGFEDAAAEPAEDTPAPEGTKLIRRDLQAEREAFTQLASAGLRPSGSSPESMLLPIRAMPTVVTKLAGDGWVISADQQALRRPGAPSLTVSSGIDWFELRGTVSYDRADGEKQEVSLPDILAAVRRGDQMITLGDGSKGLLPEAWLEEHGLLLALGRVGADGLRFKSTQAALLDALLSEQEMVQVDDAFAMARAKLREFQGLHAVEPRPDFRGLLRPYQKEGLGWLDFLRHFGFGGVLADDMGLGKTIQVLAMIQARSGDGVEGTASSVAREDAANTDAPPSTPHARRPSLVVAPKSLVFNWLDEAQKFTPELRAVAYSGTERESLRERFDQFDLVVTSYGLLRRDIEDLRNVRFDYVILDEAQAIKNPNAQAAKAARLLQAEHRLALTGTPVENHMGDLWSIFEFLNPGLLGSNAKFGDLVRASGPAAEAASPEGAGGAGGTGDVDTSVQQVAKALRPFILRRTKKQVLADLPPKTEQTIVCEMEPAQREMYDGLKAYYRQHLLTQLDTPGSPATPGTPGVSTPVGMSPDPGTPRALTGSNSFMVLEALLRLRQASCHPGLIDPARADEPSAKLEALVEMLTDVIGEGGKALIFSQFTSMLAIVQRRLEAQRIRFCYLDGQTRDRRREVDKFQNDPTIPVFLISLKAGGFGLNLTAAEYVFILDPWWNPAVEQQAIDRAHRIGQTQHVFAYRMICQDTVEQRIIELQNRKRRLADAIVDGQGDLLRTLTRDDLEQLLS